MQHIYNAYKKNRMRPGMLASLRRSVETPLLSCLVACSPFLHPSISRCLHAELTASALPSSTTTEPNYLIVSETGHLLPPFPSRVWRFGLHDCSHPVVCCSAMFDPSFLIGQLSEKVLSKGSFLPYVICIALLWILRYILIVLSASLDNDVLDGFTSVITFIVRLVTCALVMLIRKKVKKIYKIPDQCCGPCEDLCLAWWCLPCTITQIWTHVYDPDRTSASVCSTYISSEDTERENRLNSEFWYDGNLVEIGGVPATEGDSVDPPPSVVVISQPENRQESPGR